MIAIFQEECNSAGTYYWESVVAGWHALLPATVTVFTPKGPAPMRVHQVEIEGTDDEPTDDGDTYLIRFSIADYIDKDTGKKISPGTEPVEHVFSQVIVDSCHDMQNAVFRADNNQVYFMMSDLLQQLHPWTRARNPASKRQRPSDEEKGDPEPLMDPLVKRRLDLLTARVNNVVRRISKTNNKCERIRRCLEKVNEPDTDDDDLDE